MQALIVSRTTTPFDRRFSEVLGNALVAPRFSV
jgi:hypothetical protein